MSGDSSGVLQRLLSQNASNLGYGGAKVQLSFVQGLRMMFYLVTPNETSFHTTEEVPDYVLKALPYFWLFMFFEIVVLLLKGKEVRMNDSITSIAQGLFMAMSKIFIGTIEFSFYVWAYERFHFVDLPWDSSLTWWLCFFAYDLGYYFFHRYAHEVNILWAAHQGHHSSEEYNLTTALRQSAFQGVTSWMFYTPLSLAIPPSVYLVHRQFNLIYQFWIHTEVVGKLGPLEWILNTPSHHRVHHGRNPYCIDKNYGGTLIIFDRMFGTFAPESDPVSYGLVHPVNSFNTFYLQLFHYVYIIKKMWNTKGLMNKIKVMVYGPGWTEGSPRLGDPSGLPEVTFPVKKYNPQVPSWVNIYCFLHFFLVLYGFEYVSKMKAHTPYLLAVVIVVYFMYSLTCFGFMFDQKKVAPCAEIVRLIIAMTVDVALVVLGVATPLSSTFHWMLRVLTISSICLWGYVLLGMMSAKIQEKKID